MAGWKNGAVGLLLGGPLVMWMAWLLSESVLPGTCIEGAPVPEHGVREFLEDEALRWGETPMTVETGVHRFRVTRNEIGAVRPVDIMMNEIHGLGRQANPLIAFPAVARSLLGEGTDLSWPARVVDEQLLDRFARRLRDEVDRTPVPGTHDARGHEVPGMPGETLDVSLLKRSLRMAIYNGRGHLKVPTLVTPAPRLSARTAPVQREFIGTADQSVLMMRQETLYRPGSGRAENIELAARKLDGQVIAPNEVLSFNEVVGKRTARRGFQGATELRNGEVVKGIGGGVCQTAGTLHAAAFFAGFVVEEYRPHSRLNRFAYLRPGLDTMVAWPDHVPEHDLQHTRDLKVRNPYPFPVVVHTSTLPGEGRRRVLRVELMGAARAYRVDWSFSEVGRVPAGERRRRSPELAAGQERVKQAGLAGMVISRQRLIYKPTGVEQEVRQVAYPPTPRVVLYGGR